MQITDYAEGLLITHVCPHGENAYSQPVDLTRWGGVAAFNSDAAARARAFEASELEFVQAVSGCIDAGAPMPGVREDLSEDRRAYFARPMAARKAQGFFEWIMAGRPDA